MDNILHQLRLYKLNATYRTSHSSFHHPSPSPQISFPKTGNIMNQPSQQYSRRNYAVPQWTWYTIHPQSSWNSDGKSLSTWYSWPLVGFDFLIFLPPKTPWSTGHPLRRSTGLSPTDREKYTLGEGASKSVTALGENESNFDLKSHWNVCLDSNTTNSQDPRGLPMNFLYLQKCIVTSVSAGSRNNTVFSIVNNRTFMFRLV